MDYPVRDAVEIEPAATLSLSDPPEFSDGDWPGRGSAPKATTVLR